MADRLQYLRIHSGSFTRSKKSLPRGAGKRKRGGRRMENRKNSEWDTCSSETTAARKVSRRYLWRARVCVPSNLCHISPDK